RAYLSSADWMPRNFERRVEVMFPVEAPELRRRIIDEIIPTYLQDNVRARVLMPDGSYVRATAWHEEPEHRAQIDLRLAAGGVPSRAPAAATASASGQVSVDGEAKTKPAAKTK